MRGQLLDNFQQRDDVAVACPSRAISLKRPLSKSRWFTWTINVPTIWESKVDLRSAMMCDHMDGPGQKFRRFKSLRKNWILLLIGSSLEVAIAISADNQSTDEKGALKQNYSQQPLKTAWWFLTAVTSDTTPNPFDKVETSVEVDKSSNYTRCKNLGWNGICCYSRKHSPHV